MNKKICSVEGCTNKETYPFKCSLCSQTFCSKHRLPEQHSCSKIDYFQTSDYRKKKLSSQPATPLRVQKSDEKKERSHYGSKSKQRTASYLGKKDRFLARSPLFTLYSFSNNFLNILIAVLFITLMLSLNSLINLSSLKLFGARYYIVVLVIFLSVSLFYGVHELVHHFIGKKYNVNSRNALWLQGFIISVLSLLLPIFILPPAYVILQSSLLKRDKSGFTALNTPLSSKKDKGITAFAGSLWLISWEVIAGVFYLLQDFWANSVFLNSLIIAASSITRMLFGFLVFHLLPAFPLADGRYIYEWKEKLSWGLWIGNVVFFFVFFILEIIFIS